jgi:hypothetical protein
MPNVLRNEWRRATGDSFERAEILRHDCVPEGLSAGRLRFTSAGGFVPDVRGGLLLSLMSGRAQLQLGSEPVPISLEAGVHVYWPPGLEAALEAEAGAEFVYASSPTATQARGQRLLVRDETFVSACSVGTLPLRWVLTPQYLSRRIFLHHDPILLSKAGRPVSWFRTTMFDVAGLPLNEDGEMVFKMSYDSRSEFNICYDVTGDARVRMAEHPYRLEGQTWRPWAALDSETTYHLDEPAPVNGHRNKHEVYARDGHVSLFCLFDPAPTGIERHQPGAYSDYEAFEVVCERPEYQAHQREIARFDAMVDKLSLAKATGRLAEMEQTPEWALYLQGRAAQRALEAELAERLVEDGQGRERIIAPWRT